MSVVTCSPLPPQITEVKLHHNAREREMYDNLSELYSIIRATEALEKAYIKDSIPADLYKASCQKHINQFKAVSFLVKDLYPDTRTFMVDYKLDNCKAAARRLLGEPIVQPLPVIPVNRPRRVAEAVQVFITAMDCVKLDIIAADQLAPLITDLYDCLCNVHCISSEWDGLIKAKKWVATFHTMKANDRLSVEQTHQLLDDLEASYSGFHKLLANRTS